MGITPARIVNEGEPGYRAPTAHGTVDVFYMLKRYVFIAPSFDRVTWRGEVAKLILGPRGKSSDLVRLDSVLPDGVGIPVRQAKQYRIGKLKKPGAQVISKRRPGDPPLHAPAGLELVDTIRPDDPRRDVAGWGKRRGCFLVVDMVDGVAYLFRWRDRGKRAEVRDRLIRAWMLNDGPPVEVRGRWPAYGVMARQWSAEEKAAIVSRRVANQWRIKNLKGKRMTEEKKSAFDHAMVRRDREARVEIGRAAKAVDAVAVSLKRAEVSAVRWPSGAASEKVAGLWGRLDKAWRDYLVVREACIARVIGARPARQPRRETLAVGLLPRPAWVTLPGAGDDEGDD